MVRAEIASVFATYKALKDGSRKTYWYHRATGKRLNGLPGSAEFIADLARAEDFLRSRRHGANFIGLVRAYTLSIGFEQNLALATQREYSRMLTKAEARFGDMPIAILEDPRVRPGPLLFGRMTRRNSNPSSASARIIAHRLGTPRTLTMRRSASTPSSCSGVNRRPRRTKCGR